MNQNTNEMPGAIRSQGSCMVQCDAETGCLDLTPVRVVPKVASHVFIRTPLLFSPSRQTEGGQAKGENILLWDGERRVSETH